MFGHWQRHVEYMSKALTGIEDEMNHNPLLLTDSVNDTAMRKMLQLNMDCIEEDLSPFYSKTGRPSNNQPEILRSLILMEHFKHPSGLDDWVRHANATPFICALVGVAAGHMPGAATHRDFMTRIWQGNKPEHNRVVIKKPKTGHGKKKAPPDRPGIVFEMVGQALSGKTFDDIPERLIQTIFYKTTVLPSTSLGLLGNPDALTVSADGSCVLSHASPFGHKTCNCEGRCDCPRRFADPEACWGWDSYHEVYYYGYTMYSLTVHNPELKLDLPIYIRFETAKQHDSVTLIAALAHARMMFMGVFTIKKLLADSAHNNYSTYQLLDKWNIQPFIDLNPHTKGAAPQSEQADLTLNDNGVPVCKAGIEMANWGLEKAKHRRKYRCPECAGRICSCPFSDECNKTEYGKIIYLRLSENLRLFTPVQRGSDEWKKTYDQRTAVERTNTRILTDYQLERPKRYGKKNLTILAFCNAINIHLDAQINFNSFPNGKEAA